MLFLLLIESKVSTLRHGAAAPVAPIAIANRKFSNELDSSEFELTPTMNEEDTIEDNSVEVQEEVSCDAPEETTVTPNTVTKEDYILQGAIPKQRLKRSISSDRPVKKGVRTTTVGVQQQVIPLVNGEDIYEGCIDLGMNDTEDDELRTDLPQWANTASMDYGASSNNRQTGCLGNGNVCNPQIQDAGGDTPSLSLEPGEKEVKENGHEPSLETDEANLVKPEISPPKTALVKETVKPITGRERSLSSSCVPEIKLRVKGQERASVHDISEKTSDSNDKNLPKRTDSSAKRKNFRRSKSASYAENPPQGAQSKIVTDSTESEDEEVDNLEDDDHWGSSSARTRKAKLVKQYAQCQSRVFVMHNKAPLWNENTQVYQLDFGGRVTQESAKNFQVELQGKQVKILQLQFPMSKYVNGMYVRSIIIECTARLCGVKSMCIGYYRMHINR